MKFKAQLHRFKNKIQQLVTTRPPNVHMDANASVLTNLDGFNSCYARPSFSDWARRVEFESNIYAPSNVLTQKIKDIKPGLLIDIGSNIGLSSLSLLKTFPSLRTIVGVEAEKQNYELLRLNYDLWGSHRSNKTTDRVHFHPIYAIASNVSEKVVSNVTASRLDGGMSASGTFRFISDKVVVDHGIEGSPNQTSCTDVEFSTRKVSVDEILLTHACQSKNATCIIKVDIEGGEQELFSGPCLWLDRTAFLTVEIHDSMGCYNSSRPLLRQLYEHDFAILPEDDVLHCYNRKLVEL